MSVTLSNAPSFPAAKLLPALFATDAEWFSGRVPLGEQLGSEYLFPSLETEFASVAFPASYILKTITLNLSQKTLNRNIPFSLFFALTSIPPEFHFLEF